MILSDGEWRWCQWGSEFSIQCQLHWGRIHATVPHLKGPYTYFSTLPLPSWNSFFAVLQFEFRAYT
jgi:hypothetical protein